MMDIFLGLIITGAFRSDEEQVKTTAIKIGYPIIDDPLIFNHACERVKPFSISP